MIRAKLTAILLFSLAQLFAQQSFDARSTGLAFSNGADTRGLEQLGLNPATLALETDYNFDISLITFNAAGYNNSFNLGQYDKYLTTGDFLTSEDIDDIMASIPDKGIRGNLRTRLNSVSVYFQNYSIALTGVFDGNIRLPRDLIELPLRGNAEPGRIYDFDDTDGEGWTGAMISFGAGFPIPTDQWSSIDLLSFGFTAHYIAGFSNYSFRETTGELRDFDISQNNPYTHVNGTAGLLTAAGGRGVGVDLGGLITVNERLTFGISVLNAFGTISWDTDTERQLLSLRADSLFLPDGLPDAIHTDTTEMISDYSTSLPTVLDVAMAYKFPGNAMISAEYEQGFNENLGGTKQPRFAVGFEYTGLGVMPLRLGISLGGKTGSSFAVGSGVNLKHWILDLAILNHGGLLAGDIKGLGVALSSRIRL